MNVDIMIIKAFPWRLLRSKGSYKTFQRVLTGKFCPIIAKTPCAPTRVSHVHRHGTG
jgi:hypothetical protein